MTEIQERLLEALSASLKGESVKWEQLSPEILSELYNLANVHQILPLVYESTYKSQGVDPQVKSVVMRSIMMQTLQTRDFLQFYKKMNEEGMHPLVVKGILMRSLYPVPDERVSGDEDLFITPELFDTYHHYFLDHNLVAGENLESYEVAYQLKGSPLYIELHKTLFSDTSEAYGSWNQFFNDAYKRAITQTIEGVEIHTMDPNDHFLFLILHAVKHFLHGGVGIRQIADMMMFARNNDLDYDHIFKQLNLIHADVFGASLLNIGQKYLIKAPIPEQYLSLSEDIDHLLSDILDAGIYGNSSLSRKHTSNITLEAITLSNQGKTAHASLRSTLFPARSDLEGRYPYLKKHHYLLPIAWISRIMTYLSTRKEDNKATESIRLGKERVELLKEYKIIK